VNLHAGSREKLIFQNLPDLDLVVTVVDICLGHSYSTWYQEKGGLVGANRAIDLSIQLRIAAFNRHGAFPFSIRGGLRLANPSKI
jgi:hypothetical protein